MTNPFTAIIYLLLKRCFQDKELDPELIKKIEEDWDEISSINLRKALEIYPSSHLKAGEEQWLNAIDKQGRYSSELNFTEEKNIMNKYKLSLKDWENIKNKFFVKKANNFMKTEEYKRAMENVKNN